MHPRGHHPVPFFVFAAQDAFEIDTAAAMIVHHAEALLDYIEMRRRELILAREAGGSN